LSVSESVQVQCGSCGAPIAESPNTKLNERAPCSNCGSTIRRFNLSITDTLTLREGFGFKAKRQGRGKPYIEGKSGDDLHRKTGKWMHLVRVIDRARNWYTERIIDPETGTVIRNCEEPLTDHRERGSAKKKPKS
jgi:predicted RNA-binding Zn-ribbon protein involved in translation (DUF1610 family)